MLLFARAAARSTRSVPRVSHQARALHVENTVNNVSTIQPTVAVRLLSHLVMVSELSVQIREEEVVPRQIVRIHGLRLCCALRRSSVQEVRICTLAFLRRARDLPRVVVRYKQ